MSASDDEAEWALLDAVEKSQGGVLLSGTAACVVHRCHCSLLAHLLLLKFVASQKIVAKQGLSRVCYPRAEAEAAVFATDSTVG